MIKMNKSTPKEDKTNIILGKKDLILNYVSVWPIYRLNLFDKKGLWLKFKNKLENLHEKQLLGSITEQDIFNYYADNIEIEMELHFFDDIMQKQNMFKLNNIMYSYSIGKKTKNTKRIAYVRFYFDLNQFFNY
jgi:hypothetical protein